MGSNLLLVTPLDVLSHIALDTVYSSSGPPTLKDLATVRSLVLTSRIINQKLSQNINPHLYANIVRLMFDMNALRRRLGCRAVVASALASELPLRFSMLKRVRRRLNNLDHDSDNHDNLVDLARLFMMMTEDDGKNRYHLKDILGPTGLADLCLSLLSKDSQLSKEGHPTPDIAFVVALMWLNSQDAIIHEDPERRTEVLDLLQPLVLGEITDGSSATNKFDYFKQSCTVELPSAIPFARLCTVERYDFTRRALKTASETCTRPPWYWSVRFDDDFARHVKIYPPVDGGDSSRPPENFKGDSFECNWTGGWCLPCPTDTTMVYMVYRPMQCHLREYVCTDARLSMSWEDSDPENDSCRAWFPQDVEFEETVSSLNIFDPTTARWVCYQPRSELIDHTTIVDRMFYGETEPVHGSEHGSYKYHGRQRQSDGKIALVRQPANPAMDDLGIWVFRGYLFGRFDLVGEWSNTSTAKDTPAGHGWFRLTKDANQCVI